MNALLEIHDLHAGYGKVQVLHGVSLVVPEGRMVAIVGPNGAGKTTVFNALTGQEVATTAYTGSGEETNVASVKVPDPRLDFLFEMFIITLIHRYEYSLFNIWV